MESLGFCIYISSANTYTFSLASFMPFISFSCLIAQTKIFNTKLNKSDRSEHLCFVTDLR